MRISDWSSDVCSSDLKQVFDESITGPFYDPPYSVHAESDENVFTYSITPRFRISPNMTLYGRVASGYRPGGTNPGAGFGFQATYSSDTTINYEIGYKASQIGRASCRERVGQYV